MVRRPISLARIAAWSGLPWAAFLPIIKAFADPRVSFLTYAGQPGEPADGKNTVIDISHEAVIRQWASLKSWVDSESKAAQEFSEWQQRAERKDKGNGAYLTGADLSRAEIWLKKGLDFTAPVPSLQPDSAPNATWAARYWKPENAEKIYSSVEAFILQSRDASRFRQRFLSLLAGLMVTASLTTAGFGYDSYHKSLDSAAKTLWFPLQTDRDLSSGTGADHLNQVARQDEAKRLRFIEEIANDESIASRFTSDTSWLLRASIKSNFKLRNQLIGRLRADRDRVKDAVLVGKTLALCELGDDIEVEEMLRAISATKGSDPSLLAQCLVNLIGKLNDEESANVLPSLLDVVQKITDPYQGEALGRGLAAVAGKLNDNVLPSLLDVVQKTTDAYQLQALGQGLAAVAGKLNETQASAIVHHYTEAVQKTTDPFQLEALGLGVVAITEGLQGKSVEIVSVKLMQELKNNSNGSNKAVLAKAANKLIPNLAMNENQARAWLKASDIPFIDRDAVAAAIRKQYPEAPSEDQGIWPFLKWANSRFGFNRPRGNELWMANLEILLLPLLVLNGGGSLLQRISGRRLVAIQLQKLTDKKDRQGLGLRFQGYNAAQVKTHWGGLGADERVIEQHFLWMDQVFAPLYGFAFYYALSQASQYLDDPLPPAALIALVCAMVVADWTENTLQLQQLRRLDSGEDAELQTGWVRVASIATQIKLACVSIAVALLLGFSIRLTVF
jgi:hypothetical protein